MTDDPTSLPEAQVKERSKLSLVWAIPLVAALIGAWLTVKTIQERGPEVTISFRTANGLTAGKTRIRYKDVEIGRVEAVRLNHLPSGRVNVVATARLEKGNETFLKRGTAFWVVRPRLSLKGVSGLGTLVSGAYIEIEPGEGAAHYEFTGLEAPPSLKADEEGKKISLIANKLGSLSIGSPIHYQGLLAGEILGYELGNDQKSLFIHAFVKAPYDRMVRGNSRFWNVSGINVALDAGGFEVRTESMQSILMGGVAFETPNLREPPQADEEGLVFTLHDSYEDIEETAFTQKIPFVLFFDGSVRGLNPDAPVEFKGIKVGKVKDIRLEFDPGDMSFRIPVLIEVEPERIIKRGGNDKESPYQVLKTLVDKGLRARLETGSLLTGQLFVDLDIHPGSPLKLSGEKLPFPELPTLPKSLDQITDSLGDLVAKIGKIPVDEIGQELLETLQGANRTMNAPELLETIGSAKGALLSLQKVLVGVDQQMEPLAAVLNSSQTTLTQLTETMEMIDNTLKPDAPVPYGFVEMAEELAETARAIRALMESLEQNPESLLFGKQGSAQ